MIRVVIPSRNGAFDGLVWQAANKATMHASANGIAADWGTATYPYTVAACRNKAVFEFLKMERYDRLLFVDDDVIISPDSITKLAAVDADIVAGCYGSVRIKPNDTEFATAVWIRPMNPIGISVNHDGWCNRWFAGTIEASAVGGGCMMIRRNVFDKIPFPWFEWPEQLGGSGIVCQSDDGNFCDKVLAAGLTIKAVGEVRCSHLKTIDVSRLVGVIDGA